MERRKLFSSTNVTRRKLFSEATLKSVQCMDCGYVMETAASTTHLLCPKCGGDRFNVLTVPISPENVPEPVIIENKEKEELIEEKGFSRRSLFGDEIQKEFSEPSNDFEKLLKEFSGKTLTSDEVEKKFSLTSDELIEKGFAFVTEEGIKISDTAYFQSKLFSRLIVSVTKILDLDPAVSVEPKESVIESMPGLSPKCVMLLRKAHNLPPKEIVMSESSGDENNVEDWAKDSGICNDLRLEFGGSDMGIKEFTKLLDERYSDAPEGIIDHLISTGVINIQGNQVSIFK